LRGDPARNPCFIEERIGEVPLFKLAGMEYSGILVTEAVKQATAGLAGVAWRPAGIP